NVIGIGDYETFPVDEVEFYNTELARNTSYVLIKINKSMSVSVQMRNLIQVTTAFSGMGYITRFNIIENTKVEIAGSKPSTVLEKTKAVNWINSEGGGIEEAPDDGKKYGRQNESWEEIDETDTTYSEITQSDIDTEDTTGKVVSGKTLAGLGGLDEVSHTNSSNIETTGKGTTASPLQSDLTQAAKNAIAEGVTAHEWGDHAQAGYKKTDTTY